MQEIRLAKTAGFCFGVNRAVSMVYAMLEEGKTVYTLGPIIHNPQVVTDLEKRGVVIVDETGEVPQGAVLVVRTHGVPSLRPSRSGGSTAATRPARLYPKSIRSWQSGRRAVISF